MKKIILLAALFLPLCACNKNQQPKINPASKPVGNKANGITIVDEHGKKKNIHARDFYLENARGTPLMQCIWNVDTGKYSDCKLVNGATLSDVMQAYSIILKDRDSASDAQIESCHTREDWLLETLLKMLEPKKTTPSNPNNTL